MLVCSPVGIVGIEVQIKMKQSINMIPESIEPAGVV